MNYGFLKDKNGNKIYINDNSIYHEGKKLNDAINELDKRTEYTLFEYAKGVAENITLNDSAENYKYIKVFVNFEEYVSCNETNTNKINISSLVLNEDALYSKCVILEFNRTTCTQIANYSAVSRANEYIRYGTNRNKIIKIVGYK